MTRIHKQAKTSAREPAPDASSKRKEKGATLGARTPARGWAWPSLGHVFCYVNLALGGALAAPALSRRGGGHGPGDETLLGVSSYFGDNMVLHHANASIFGHASRGESVHLKVPELNLEVETQAGEDEHWEACLGALPVGGPYTLQVSGSREFELQNILAGEVWMLSGQSNLDVRLIDLADGTGWAGNYSAPWQDRAKAGLQDVDNEYLRLMTTQRTWADASASDIAIKLPWAPANYDSVAYSGAIGYLLGKQLQHGLQVPVGIVYNVAAGSAIRQWISPPHLQTLSLAQGSERERPSSVYHGMLAPIRGLSFSGIVWYQGETDTGAGHGSGVDKASYHALMPLMAQTIRDVTRQPELPMLIVQLAGWGDKQPSPAFYEDCDVCLIREAQAQQAANDPHAALVVTTDTSDVHNIHVPNKWDVATRLHLAAMRMAYAHARAPVSPTFAAATVNANFTDISFHNAHGGLVLAARDAEAQRPSPQDATVRGIAIRDDAGTWSWAEGTLVDRNRSLRISHPFGTPSAIRYNWVGHPEGNLFHVSGLPVAPWRTDK